MAIRRILPGFAAVFLLGACQAQAGWFFHHDKPHPTPEPGKPRHFCDSPERAGYPLALSGHLEPSNTNEWCGHYVGGGGGHGSGPRCRTEGTWGWDYTGHLFPRKVFLGWNHGGRYQGGTGYYQNVDPFPIPNVFAANPLGALHHKAAEDSAEH